MPIKTKNWNNPYGWQNPYGTTPKQYTGPQVLNSDQLYTGNKKQPWTSNNYKNTSANNNISTQDYTKTGMNFFKNPTVPLDPSKFINGMQDEHSTLYSESDLTKNPIQNNDVSGYQTQYNQAGFNQSVIQPNINRFGIVSKNPNSGDWKPSYQSDGRYGAITDARRILPRQEDYMPKEGETWWDAQTRLANDTKQWAQQGQNYYLDNNGYYKLNPIETPWKTQDTPVNPPNPSNLYGTHRTPSTLLPKILSGINDNMGSIIDTARYLGTLHNNQEVSKETLAGIKPLLQNTYNLQGRVVGDMGTRQYYDEAAQKYENKAAQPLTSDSSLQLANQYEAQNKADELREKGFIADNQKIGETTDMVNKLASDNMARQSNVANQNMESMLNVDKAKHDILAATKSAQWQTSDNYLKGMEDKIDQYKYMSQALDTDKQNKLAELTASESMNTPEYQTAYQNLQTAVNNLSKEDNLTNRNAYTSALNTKNQLELQAKKNYYTNLYNSRQSTLNRQFNPFRWGNYKKGGTLFNSSLTSTTNYPQLVDNNIEKATNRTMRSISGLSTVSKKLILNAMTSKKAPKFQQGGGMPPFTIYTPTPSRDRTTLLPMLGVGAGQSGKVTTTKTSSKASADDGEMKMKDLMGMLDKVDGLPSDMNKLFGDLSSFYTRQQLLGDDTDTSHLANQYISALQELKMANFDKKEYDNAYSQAVTKGALNETAITEQGTLVALDKDNKLTQVSVDQYKSNPDSYKVLSNSDLLKLRAEHPKFAFSNDVLATVSNGTSMKEVTKLVTDAIGNLGSDETSQTMFSSPKMKNVAEGAKYLQEISQTYPGISSVDSMFKLAKTSKTQVNQINAALSYVMQALPKNAQTWLALHFKNPSEGIINLTSMHSSSDINYDATPMNDPNAAPKTQSTIDSSPELNMITGMAGTENSKFELNSGTSHSLSTTGTYYSQLPLTGETYSLQQLLRSGIGGIVTNPNAIKFGNNTIDPSHFGDIMYSGGGGLRVILPTVTDNAGNKSVDLDILKTYEKAYDTEIKNIKGASVVLNGGIYDNNIQETNNIKKQIGQIFHKYHLDELTLGNGLPNTARLNPFLVVNGYAVNKNEYLKNTDFAQLVTDDNVIDNVAKGLSTGPEKNNYTIDKNNWYDFNGHDDVYKGSIYIPLTTNKLAAVTAANQQVKQNDAYALEYEQQTYDTRQAHPNALASSSVLNLN